MCRYAWVAIGIVSLLTATAHAWGPHPQITRAALEVLPNLPEVKQKLGESNVAALQDYCWLPDHRGRDLGSFYADDFLLIPDIPRHVGHVMPSVKVTFEPYFRRALLALRTETPTNACRQLGPLVHFVEDVGAPPHAKENCPHHGELENWVKAELISIKGYQPKLLGNTDDEAVAGLLKRIEGLVEFSKERAERALPLVSQPHPDRSQVEPIILESALETARVTADVLYTVFTLGLKSGTEPGTTRLTVLVTASKLAENNDQEARVVLLGSPYSTLTEAQPTNRPDRWFGKGEFRNLPSGTYELAVYRPGALPAKMTVTLAEGESKEIEITLSPTDPPQNLVYNPDFTLHTLPVETPDRWTVTTHGDNKVWTSATIVVKPGTIYRCGAILKSSNATVTFIAQPAQKPGKSPAPTQVTINSAQPGPKQSEVELTADADHSTMVVQISGPDDAPHLVEKVWVVPAR